ncbi:MAG: SusC/RagA family TonB-linked outer membrane protein [Tannerellaceae bacterium]|nr:SusC/RagA family TonB-linked outer membrane protein [Tannerellaceae bacterium]
MLNLSLFTHAQQTTLNLNIRNKTIKEALMQIENQTEYRFLYENQTSNLDKKVTLDVKGQPVEQVLKQLLKKEGINYTITENNLILINPSSPVRDRVTNDTTQGITISGTVTDETGETLPGASIQVKGSTVGIISDMDGYYTITVPNKNAILVFSYIGYQAQEVPVGNKTVVNVRMQEDAQQVEEVIVVGYGVQRKASAVGAITAIKGDKLTVAPVVNLSAGLAGQAPGLVAMNRTGEPGNDGAVLRIRGENTLGDNQPLVVIDGIANRHGGLDRIDPNDVESISILKDASAAIYGAQAANGVILVTTKRGKTGKPQVKYSYNQGFAQATRFPEMADAATYATMMNELAEYSGNLPVYTPKEIAKFRDGSEPWLYPNTDWFAETMKTMSPQYKQNLSINGGTEHIQYYVSIGTLGQDGFYKNSGTRYDQYNLRSNFDAKLNDYISVGVGLNAREEKKEGLNQFNYYELLMIAKPTAVAFWPNGLPGPAVQGNTNPAIGASKEAGYNRTKNYYVQSDFRLEVKNPWIKELKFVGNFAYDKQFQFYKEFRKSMTTYNWDKVSYDENGDPLLVPYTRPADSANPELQQSARDIYNLVVNATLQYSKAFHNDHNLSVLAGLEGTKGSNSYLYAQRKYYISDAIDELFAGGDRDKDNTGETDEFARVNYFGRLNYG